MKLIHEKAYRQLLDCKHWRNKDDCHLFSIYKSSFPSSCLPFVFSLIYTLRLFFPNFFFFFFLYLPLLISLPCVFDLASFSSRLLLCFIFRSLFSVSFHTSWFCPLSSSLLFWSSILPLVCFSLLSSFPPISSYSLILIPAHLFVIKYNKNV